MTISGNSRVVMVTASDIETARRLSKLALENRLIACANLIPGLESRYWWEGEIQSEQEVLMIMKTEERCLSDLEKLILENHPYDTPEFIVLPIKKGSEAYLNWISDSVKSDRQTQ